MSFTIFPAIDLRHGQVVRLQQGDLNRQTVYANDPASTAEKWCAQGAQWMHVVNLDGAFEQSESANLQALRAILAVTQRYGVAVQFGGGVRTLQDVETLLIAGVERVILGTVAVTDPTLVETAIAQWGAERVAVGIDAKDGIVRIRGWAEASSLTALDLAGKLAQVGLRWVIFTDIARDGVGSGLNLAGTQKLAHTSGLQVIASGGVHTQADVQAACTAGLAGAIVGRALYEGTVQLPELLVIGKG
ncbi:MAG TPA: 1-(5-phosphoribosyl)-5-[(5-phosphoribosylamino)methylideneamino]imidazole-4-carboxamide isomerase [Anaerolineales bacterium]|nr:1-(5-phosphoribosyl)-5-[(5-phosphoribosylamino)methylideneamino]imidazole-4-carboxamide isomerase [Anaerolineales bacterium]